MTSTLTISPKCFERIRLDSIVVDPCHATGGDTNGINYGQDCSGPCWHITPTVPIKQEASTCTRQQAIPFIKQEHNGLLRREHPAIVHEELDTQRRVHLARTEAGTKSSPITIDADSIDDELIRRIATRL